MIKSLTEWGRDVQRGPNSGDNTAPMRSNPPRQHARTPIDIQMNPDYVENWAYLITIFNWHTLVSWSKMVPAKQRNLMSLISPLL